MSALMRLGQFDVRPGRCGSPLHSDTCPREGLCVQIGGIAVCRDCVQEYWLDFDEAVAVWMDHRGELVH